MPDRDRTSLMHSAGPYLSVVATARNDDHGGNLLQRMQTFVNALLAQAKRHIVPLELILVEWNPPADRPKLAEALRWPEDLEPSTVRILEVAPEVHRRYRHADALPLYQMIAKNAGIRRARGQFVLATNVDIVFSDELFRFFAERGLQSGKMYRVDRYDVMSGVPIEASVDEQLAYCRSHLLRLNAREGTFRLTPEGLRALEPEDVASRGSGIFFGRGWFAVESHSGELFRWAYDDAEVTLNRPQDRAPGLVFELEPGPGTSNRPFLLHALDNGGKMLAEARVAGRSVVRIQTPSECPGMIRLRVSGGGRMVPHDPRVLNFRVFRCSWSDPAGPVKRSLSGSAAAHGFGKRVALLAARTWDFFRRGIRFLGVLRRADGPVRIGLPLPPRLVAKLDLKVEGGGISFAIDPSKLRRKARTPAGSHPSPAETAETLHPVGELPPPGGVLHTNGCGDFTLMAREHWLDLRGYPEFDLFSMNIDSILCYAAHYAGICEQFLDDPVRIYHIEHATGSGWTPEGQAELFERIAAQGLSWVDYHEVAGWAHQMRRFGTPFIFNRKNWGLADFALPERTIQKG